MSHALLEYPFDNKSAYSKQQPETVQSYARLRRELETNTIENRLADTHIKRRGIETTPYPDTGPVNLDEDFVQVSDYKKCGK